MTHQRRGFCHRQAAPLLIFLMLLCAAVTHGQGTYTPVYNYGYEWQRGNFLVSLGFPGDTTRPHISKQNNPHWGYKNGLPYYWDPFSLSFKPVGGSVDSLIYATRARVTQQLDSMKGTIPTLYSANGTLAGSRTVNFNYNNLDFLLQGNSRFYWQFPATQSFFKYDHLGFEMQQFSHDPGGATPQGFNEMWADLDRTTGGIIRHSYQYGANAGTRSYAAWEWEADAAGALNHWYSAGPNARTDLWMLDTGFQFLSSVVYNGGALIRDQGFRVYKNGEVGIDTMYAGTSDKVMVWDPVAKRIRFRTDLSGGGSSYTFQHSVVNNAGVVNLSGDVASPGNSKYYGTNASGTRGFYDLPSGGSTVNPTLTTLAYWSTTGWDYATQGPEAKLTLTGNSTLSITNLPAGEVVYLSLEVHQDATGSRSLTLPAGTKVINGGGGAVTLSTTGGSVDLLTFRWNGTTLYCNYGPKYN